MDTVMRDVNGKDMRKYDMYYHPESENGIPANWRNWRIVVRYSGDGPDYWSGVSQNALIREGLDLAIELGYIKGLGG
jgi:hypothetical protein